MELISNNVNNQLVGLRVVRGPNWEWDTQDGGEGFVGTVVGIVGNAQNPRNVEICWDSGDKFNYRTGAEGAYDLRVLDNSTVGVKHPGVKCQECNQENISGLRWQCFDCPEPINLCTFCFTNEKHDQSHVNFKRYDRPSSIPIDVRLISDNPKIQLKGIFPGALVRSENKKNWKYNIEDGFDYKYLDNYPIGEVVPIPIGRERKPGKVWVQWPHEEDESYSYRVGFDGKVDLRMAKAGLGGHYQPHTLPILKISEPKANEKTNDVAVDFPLVVGDTVKLAVGLEELREMKVDCGMYWDPARMKEIVSRSGTITEIDKLDKTIGLDFGVDFLYVSVPEKAIQRLIPWLPRGAALSVCNGSHSIGMPDDVMTGDFGRVKKVNFDGETVDMEFFSSVGVITKTLPVNQLKEELLVDMSLVEKLESIRKDLAKMLVSEVEKGATLSVEYLLENYPNIVDCQISYNKQSSTALSVACQKGNLEVVKLLLKSKANVDIKDEMEDEENEEDEVEETGYKPIHHAVLRNHPEVMKLLLENGASPQDGTWNRKTALHLAAMYGNAECLRLLLEDERCDPNNKDCSGRTAFVLAVESPVQSVEIFNLFHGLIEKLKITVTDDDFLHSAIRHNNFEAVKFLLSYPEGKIFARNLSLNKAARKACCKSQNQIAKLLVSHMDKDEDGKPWGINNTPDIEPLIKVVKNCNYELTEFLTRFLIEAGANLQATDSYSETLFHYAASLFRNKKKNIRIFSREETPMVNWPNEETSPEIFKIYNELKTKRPDKYLCPLAAVVIYLVSKGAIPINLTLPDVEKLIGDDFLYGEIIKICPDPDLMVSNVSSEGTLQHPHHLSEVEEERRLERSTYDGIGSQSSRR